MKIGNQGDWGVLPNKQNRIRCTPMHCLPICERPKICCRKNPKLAKALQEQNLYKFRQIIAYKGKKNGIRVLLADRWYPSSKMCSCCGNVKTDLKLSDRTYHCDICGFTMDRDENAAINIENCNKFKKIKVA